VLFRSGGVPGHQVRSGADRAPAAGSACRNQGMTKYPMTLQGARALEEELKNLKAERPKISQAIAEARELGDLKENAEYHAAREQQGLVEARIRDIEGRLQNAQIIDITSIPHTGKVIFGTTVDIVNVDTDEQVTYQIVGDDEADIKAGKLSVSSPIARALVGKSEGDVVAVSTPSGVVEYEILEGRHIGRAVAQARAPDCLAAGPDVLGRRPLAAAFRAAAGARQDGTRAAAGPGSGERPAPADDRLLAGLRAAAGHEPAAGPGRRSAVAGSAWAVAGGGAAAGSELLCRARQLAAVQLPGHGLLRPAAGDPGAARSAAAPRGWGASGLIAQQIGEVAVRLGIAAVHQGHLADGLHQFAAGAAAQLLEQRLAVLALGDPQLDLDQLVVHEGALQLGHHPFAEAIVGDGQDRLQVVTDGFDLFLLLLRERHNQALMFH